MSIFHFPCPLTLPHYCLVFFLFPFFFFLISFVTSVPVSFLRITFFVDPLTNFSPVAHLFFFAIVRGLNFYCSVLDSVVHYPTHWLYTGLRPLVRVSDFYGPGGSYLYTRVISILVRRTLAFFIFLPFTLRCHGRHSPSSFAFCSSTLFLFFPTKFNKFEHVRCTTDNTSVACRYLPCLLSIPRSPLFFLPLSF